MNGRLMFFLIPMLLGRGEVAAAQEQPRKPSFAIVITASLSEIKVGLPVPLRLALTNTSDEPMHYSGGIVNGPVFRKMQLRQIDIQVHGSDGKPVAETEYGKTIHGRSIQPPPVVNDPSAPGRPVPGSGSHAIMSALDPRQTLTEESDLSKEFDLTKPGKYTVQAFQKDGNTGLIVISNKITFTITE